MDLVNLKVRYCQEQEKQARAEYQKEKRHLEDMCRERPRKEVQEDYSQDSQDLKTVVEKGTGQDRGEGVMVCKEDKPEPREQDWNR